MKKSKLKIIINRFKKVEKKKLTKQDRIFLGIGAGIMMAIILFTAYLIWFIWSQKSIAGFLPAEKTVTYVEIKEMSLPVKLKTGSLLDEENTKATLKNIFDFNYNDDIRSWADGRWAVALVQNDKEESIPVLAIQTYSKRNAMKFFQSLLLSDEVLLKEGKSKSTIYSYEKGQAFHFTFAGAYTFISKDIEKLKEIQEVRAKKITPLTEDINYQTSFNNLPRQDWMRGYANFSLVNLGEEITIRNITEPLKTIINNFAFSVKKNPNGFHFNTFVNLNKDVLVNKKGFSDNTHFAYKLTDLISSKGIVSYIGGANLSKEWENTLETIANLNPAYGVILEGVLRAQINKVFGEKVDLRNDLYPLLEGEYALAIGTEEGETVLSLLLSHNDRDFTEKKMEKMMDGFRVLAAAFAPKLQIVMLPDGTESHELVADNTQMKEVSEEYEGYDVHCLEVKKTGAGFCYTVTEDLLAVTNSHEKIIETIDMTLSPEFTLSQYQPFRQTISNMSKVSDEITFIDMQHLIPIIENKTYGALLTPYLKNFSAASWVKHYFDDGVSSEGYLLIK